MSQLVGTINQAGGNTAASKNRGPLGIPRMTGGLLRMGCLGAQGLLSPSAVLCAHHTVAAVGSSP